jgi:hypothetical protein
LLLMTFFPSLIQSLISHLLMQSQWCEAMVWYLASCGCIHVPHLIVSDLVQSVKLQQAVKASPTMLKGAPDILALSRNQMTSS